MARRPELDKTLGRRRLPTGKPQTIRDLNRAAVLDLIRRHQPLSRADLARLTNIHRSNISLIVEDVARRQVLTEERPSVTARGRTPQLLSLERTRFGVLGVNVRYAYSTVALASLSGQVDDTITFDTPATPDQFLDKLEETFRELVRRQGERSAILRDVRQIALSIPGIANRSGPGKTTVWTPAMPGYSEWNMAGAIEKRLGIPTSVSNNAQLAAMATLRHNEKQKKRPPDDFVFLMIGDIGIGSGVVIQQHVYGGFDASFAGEVGHAVIDSNGPMCTCGRRGCWNLYITDMATLKRYDPKLKFSTAAFNNFLEEVNKGEARAVQALAATARYLSLGLSNIAVMMNPERIVIGGAIMQCWPLLKEELKSIFFLPHHESLIQPTDTPADTLFLEGAIELALDRFFSESNLRLLEETQAPVEVSA